MMNRWNMLTASAGAFFLSLAILLLSEIKMVECSTFIPRACPHMNKTMPIMTTENAALAMNSIEFLKELVRLKDTRDEKYYQEGHHGDEVITAACAADPNPESASLNSIGNNNHARASVVEYTGKLWLLNKSKVRFQERVEIDEISPCGKYSIIHCITRYKTGHQNADWADCAKVSCRVEIPDHDNEVFDIVVQSDLLVKLPLFGLGKSVRRKISDTFENAAVDFFKSCGNNQ